MLRSSLGFHTMTLSMWMLSDDTAQLVADFKKYSQETGAIQIYSDAYKNVIIKFFRQDRGIEWRIHPDVYLERNKFSVDFIYVTINPKILGGIYDYITAATINDMAAAISAFNRLSQRISPLLQDFEMYSLTRIDYCVNFSLNELAPGCTPKQIMKLIKRSDIPPSYKEWTKYDEIAHRTKSSPSSFYLVNRSVHINCYSKYMKYEDQSQQNVERGWPPISQVTMDAARDIIRFEVQCKYPKVYALSHKNKRPKGTLPNKYRQLLAHEVCIDKIDSYYKRTIGRGDWYILQEAIHRVQSYHFNSQKEERLVKALKLVNDCHSVAKEKTAYQGRDLDAFKRTLSDLSSLGINPVTIPRDWGIKHIPNLLYAYSDKVSEEELREDREKFRTECLKEFLHA